MKYPLNRRAFLIQAMAVAASPLAGAVDVAAEPVVVPSMAALEKELNGRIGVFALDTGSDKTFAHRADERFAFCSTFKVLLAGAVLQRSASNAGLLQQTQRYTQQEVVHYSPQTEKHVGEGMTVAALCAAALQYSDNTAANVLLKLLGGPAAVTAFARSIGDMDFRLDRYETELNTAIPGDPRDTTTPKAMAHSLRRLALGDALGAVQRAQLCEWMRGNTTGGERIAAAVPDGWEVGDKTGTGDYASANDVAVIWPPGRAPIILAVYTTQHDKDAKSRSDIVAAAARVALAGLGVAG